MATLRSQTQSGSADTSTLQNLLGTAAVAGGLYKNLGGSTGISSLASSAGNFLRGFGSTPSYYDPMTQSGGFTGSSLAPFFYGSGGSGD
jgi:hypothetical protein